MKRWLTVMALGLALLAEGIAVRLLLPALLPRQPQIEQVRLDPNEKEMWPEEDGSGLAFPPMEPGITRANFARIKKGMRQEEVESLLGHPPGDYATGMGYYPPAGNGLVVWKGRTELWTGNEGRVKVVFDDNGLAYKKFFEEVHLVEE